MPSSKSATVLGAGAIMLWSLLATCTVLKGPIPPFQTTAIAFAIGGSAGAALAFLRGRMGLIKPTAASLALGIYGLFCYHALYFAALRLAPPAEAHLIASLWALLAVLFSGLLPGSKLRGRHVLGALMGLCAATLLVWPKIGQNQGVDYRLGFALAVACACIWSTYSVVSRLLAEVPSESLAVSCLVTAGLACLCSFASESWTSPADWVAWVALAGLGLGPTGLAFFLWDVGMKHGDVPLLGVLAYASPIISTGLLTALGLAQASWNLALACALMVGAGAIAARPD